MSEESVTLEFIAWQVRGLRDEVRSLRDDMGVLTAIVLRHERQLERINDALAEMLGQMRAMVAQHQRFGDRLAGLDERLRTLEEEPR